MEESALFEALCFIAAHSKILYTEWPTTLCIEQLRFDIQSFKKQHTAETFLYGFQQWLVKKGGSLTQFAALLGTKLLE